MMDQSSTSSIRCPDETIASDCAIPPRRVLCDKLVFRGNKTKYRFLSTEEVHRSFVIRTTWPSRGLCRVDSNIATCQGNNTR
mmetsp:Transcript_16657/g.34310  ORF Transcript_16657/g.34310 Transcript_16657/m.34310 type:complete len:82 (+) Transcript_16657:106-351(+)